jgi:hypothetical protein
MILFHYTSARHLRGISQYGLTVGDVPTDIHRASGRIGVWLTTSPLPNGLGLENSAVNKKEYRLSVSLDESSPLLCKWSEWSATHVTPDTLHALHATDSLPETWWVYFGVIAPAGIIECTSVLTGESVPNWSDLSPPELDVKGVPAWRRGAWQKRMLKDVRRALRQQAD